MSYFFPRDERLEVVRSISGPDACSSREEAERRRLDGDRLRHENEYRCENDQEK